MARTLKILGVHGLGDHRESSWKEDWQAAVTNVFPAGSELQLAFSFVDYDAIFANVDISAWETMQAVWKLSRSAVSTAVSGHRGVVRDVSEKIKWTAGYVVAWVEDDAFKVKTRKLVLDAIARERPDVVLAHSLGSLITYNAFCHPDAEQDPIKTALARTHYVTLGSQIGNPFVVGNLTNGRIDALPVKWWHHLYNQHDAVFTAPIRLWDATNFRQVNTPFDIDGIADHSAPEYLQHGNTIDNVWQALAADRSGARSMAGRRRPSRRRASAGTADRPARRALLVGINAYPREEDRLDGCVNDVFLMSSVLQECGFPPESIRVCLDQRATASGIRERLRWLLDDPRPGEERVFYYSGHGARIPAYGENFEPDRQTESLVPWDFDWSEDTAIIDDQIFALYSQLPYQTRFAMIMDCCHSGGIHRQGGARVRGINPPDDIRHRELEWDKDTDMWVARGFKPLNKKFSSQEKVNEAFFGEDGATTRLGRASIVRGQSQDEYRRRKRRLGTPAFGPYLPLIVEACGEEQFSYEYRHGVTSYGAFTFALCKNLRKARRISFKRLVEETTRELARLGYQQTPQILGPSRIVRSRVPWQE